MVICETAVAEPSITVAVFPWMPLIIFHMQAWLCSLCMGEVEQEAVGILHSSSLCHMTSAPLLWTTHYCEQLVNATFWFVLKPDTNIQCSVSSEDIEKSFKTNPCGSISFTTSKFSYKIDFSGMFPLLVVCF